MLPQLRVQAIKSPYKSDRFLEEWWRLSWKFEKIGFFRGIFGVVLKNIFGVKMELWGFSWDQNHENRLGWRNLRYPLRIPKKLENFPDGRRQPSLTDWLISPLPHHFWFSDLDSRGGTSSQPLDIIRRGHYETRETTELLNVRKIWVHIVNMLCQEQNFLVSGRR